MSQHMAAAQPASAASTQLSCPVSHEEVPSSSVESSLREFQWQLQLRARLQAVFTSIRKHFYLQNVCCAQVWLSSSGCQQEQNLGQMQLYADPNLAVMGDAEFASFRQLSCQSLLPGRAGMPGRAWIGGCVQVVQNLAIIPSCLHPRPRLTPAQQAAVAEVVYITVYDPARPRVGPVAVIEALTSARSTDSMMVANFISFVGSALLGTGLTLCDPAPKPFCCSKLAGRKPVLVSEPDVASSWPPSVQPAVTHGAELLTSGGAAVVATLGAAPTAQGTPTAVAAATAAVAATTRPAAAAAPSSVCGKRTYEQHRATSSGQAAALGGDAELDAGTGEECDSDGEGTADNDATPAVADGPRGALHRACSVAGLPSCAWQPQQRSVSPTPQQSGAAAPAHGTQCAAAAAAVAAVSAVSDATANMGALPTASACSTGGGSALMPAPRSKHPVANAGMEAPVAVAVGRKRLCGGATEACTTSRQEEGPPTKRLTRASSMGRTKSVPVDLHILGEVASTASSKPQLAAMLS